MHYLYIIIKRHMKDKKILYTIVGLTLAFLIAVLFLWQKYEKHLDSVNRYFQSSEDFKRYVIQNVAAYEDYINSEREKELRTYLLMDHLKIARDLKYAPVNNDQEIAKLVKEGQLKYVDSGAGYPFYFYNVPKELRYLRGFTKEGLNLISDRFSKNLFEKLKVSAVASSQDSQPGQKSQKINERLSDKFKVKLAISSAVRPVEYQKALRGRNGNASFESTHSYGISVDIFYDDFYVTSGSGSENSFKKSDLEKIRKINGFNLGGSLRRQFQTVLSKTLLELQREHKLYAILETNQKCYHVTILP